MRIFLTGATGFIGRLLLERLRREGADEVRCLVSDPSRLPADPRVTPVRGRLPHDVGGIVAALAGCDRVIHLAGPTGNARPEEHRRVHVDGTAALVGAAREAGVPRFVHVSTIAVTYPEKKHYPYARAKEEAEAVVRASGLDWAILRPTIVLGARSPLLRPLGALASAPVLPLPGGGRATIQPVHVDDVAAALAALAREPSLGGRTVELGGRDTVTFGAFLARLRVRRTGHDGPRVPVPLGPLVGALGALERLGVTGLPVTAGQFYAFRHDGTARDDPQAEPPRAARRGVDEIVTELADALDAPPTEEERRARLEAECSVFGRYLCGIEPGDAIRRHYLRAHEPGSQGPVPAGAPDDPLVAWARRGPAFTRVADGWAALFDRRGPLRSKLVLMLAMLESVADTSRRVDGPTTPGTVAFLLGAALRGVRFVLLLPVAAVTVGPRAWAARSRRRRA